MHENATLVERIMLYVDEAITKRQRHWPRWPTTWKSATSGM